MGNDYLSLKFSQLFNVSSLGIFHGILNPTARPEKLRGVKDVSGLCCDLGNR